MDHPKSNYDAVVATLKELGLCADPASLIRTILLRDRFFVGHKYRFDGGHALWIAATNVIEVYDNDGNLLKTAARGQTESAA